MIEEVERPRPNREGSALPLGQVESLLYPHVGIEKARPTVRVADGITIGAECRINKIIRYAASGATEARVVYLRGRGAAGDVDRGRLLTEDSVEVVIESRKK